MFTLFFHIIHVNMVTLFAVTLFSHGSWNRSRMEGVPVVRGGIVSSMFSILTQQMSSFCSQWENGGNELELNFVFGVVY
jgi:hypothetical protein